MSATLNAAELLKGTTPGPWKINAYPAQAAITDPTRDDVCIARVYQTDPDTRRRSFEFEANARLVQAAPTLAARVLELEHVLTHIVEATRAWDSIGEKEANECAKAALAAKSEGLIPA